MNKKYRPQGKNKYLCLLLLLLPVFYWFATHQSTTGFYVTSASFILVSINGYLYFNRIFAEIKENQLNFYRGIGFHDQTSIALNEIQQIDRRGKQLLAIIPKTTDEFSFEADKSVINQLEKDLSTMISS